ncbi:hypothetical protein [Niallia sp. 03091]
MKTAQDNKWFNNYIFLRKVIDFFLVSWYYIKVASDSNEKT